MRRGVETVLTVLGETPIFRPLRDGGSPLSRSATACTIQGGFPLSMWRLSRHHRPDVGSRAQGGACGSSVRGNGRRRDKDVACSVARVLRVSPLCGCSQMSAVSRCSTCRARRFRSSRKIRRNDHSRVRSPRKRCESYAPLGPHCFRAFFFVHCSHNRWSTQTGTP